MDITERKPVTAIPDAELVQALDREFASLTPDERILRAWEVFGDGLIATTSFGRDSGLLLHHIYRLKRPIRVWFIDTNFHFAETLEYRNTLVSHYALDLREVRNQEKPKRFAIEVANVVSISDTDACCALNKVGPQASILGRTDVTAVLSGLRRDQSVTRKSTPFVRLQHGKVKIAPLADMPAEDVDLYLRLWEVPEHPLAAQGFTSIGCAPGTCTAKPLPGQDGRAGRWAGQDKTECGLHVDFNL